jgi:Lipid A 3-O-deacylase (PagL)
VPVLVAVFLLMQTAGWSQQTETPLKHRAESQVVIEGGSSVGNIHVFAYADNRRVMPFGLEYDRHSWGGLLGARVDYVAEVLPVVLLDEPASYGADSKALTTARQLEYGFGFSPIGVRLLWRRGKCWRPYLMGKGGILVFTHPVLSPGASRLNYNAQFGAGMEKRLTPRIDLRLGYTDFHFSNGDTSQRNPGIDFMYLNAGVVFHLVR